MRLMPSRSPEWRRAGMLLACLLSPAGATHAGDRLLATGGLMDIEGSGGGGLTPWALIAGLGTDTQLGASAYCTRVSPQDFTLESCGVAAGIANRVELSVSRQHFDLGSTVPGNTISMTTVGAKVRVFGDALIDQDRWWPQIAVGAQWKHNSDFDIVPALLGARHADGVDYYVAATKVWLAGPLDLSWIADLTLRETEANQLGLLGFGGDLGGYRLMAEGSLGVFLTDSLVLGGEYREKPNDLSAFREQDFKDAFLAWFPVKYVSITGAWTFLGNIADKPSQQGVYISLQLSY
jgi:hypothetical protein